MRIAIIGRTESLLDTAIHLRDLGHQIALVVTAKEAPEYAKSAEDFAEFARHVGAAFFRTPKIADIVGELRSAPSLDIGVSLNYPGLIPTDAILPFRLGILNAHGGDLPRYRGNACQAWAILSGEQRIGYCIHRMVGGELDSGDIICRDYFQIDVNTRITAVYDWMRRRTPAMFAEAIQLLDRDPAFVLERQAASPEGALRCYPRRPEDGRIDWSKSNVEILRLINATNKPYGGAFCEYEGRRLTIWDACLAPNENFLAVPGQITRIGAGFVEVATGRQKLRVREIEVDGKCLPPDQLFHSLRSRLT